jgi:sugar/nucleoside kinase (ribokinase family)
MPRLLAVGHVTWDKLPGRATSDVVGGAVSYGALAARRLGWEAAVLTSAGRDLDPAVALPGVEAFVQRSTVTTRFVNSYDADGTRSQVLAARADDVDLSKLPDAWRDPDALLLAPVAREIGVGSALSFGASVVGAIAQGWLRSFEPDGAVVASPWRAPAFALQGVHVLFLSEHDLPPGSAPAGAFLEFVPLVCVTRGWEGVTLLSRHTRHEVPSLPREEVDPTGAGDVFAASFLVRYHETGDALEAAAFAACSASCAVEGVGASTLGDRAEVEKRLALRERLIDEGEWDE